MSQTDVNEFGCVKASNDSKACLGNMMLLAWLVPSMHSQTMTRWAMEAAYAQWFYLARIGYGSGKEPRKNE